MLIEVAVRVVARILKCILTRIVELAMMPSSGACGVDVCDLKEGRVSAGDTEHGRKERESGGPRGWWWYEEEGALGDLETARAAYIVSRIERRLACAEKSIGFPALSISVLCSPDETSFGKHTAASKRSVR